MSGWYDQYDDELEDRQKSKSELDHYYAKREAAIAEKEAQLLALKAEAEEFYRDSRAKATADAAKWRSVEQQITPNMTGEDILRLYKQNGI